MSTRARYAVLLLVASAVLGLCAWFAFSLLFAVPVPRLPLLVLGFGLFLLVFMSLLLLRYVALMWFAFLDQIEETDTPPLAGCPPVSLILPAYNEGVCIQASIRSLLELDYPSFEILVVDDGSTDDTYLRARELEGQQGSTVVRVITKRNGGKSSALNVGIACASAEIVLCMDADSKLAPGSLRHAITHFRDPSVGAVAGNVKVINRRNVLTRLQALEYVEGLNMVRRAQAFFHTINIIPGPMGLFRRHVIMEAGGYKHDTFAEDCDLTLSILERGWKIRYESEAVAFTEAPEDLNSFIKQRYRWTRGILQALRKRTGKLGSTRNRGLTGALWYMALEGFVWPVVNVLAQIYLVYLAAAYGYGAPLVLWWFQLTVLDLVAALYCVVAEEEHLSLVPYAVLHRLCFTVFLDAIKVLATIEEFLAVEMSWGKLERQGRL